MQPCPYTAQRRTTEPAIEAVRIFFSYAKALFHNVIFFVGNSVQALK